MELVPFETVSESGHGKKLPAYLWKLNRNCWHIYGKSIEIAGISMEINGKRKLEMLEIKRERERALTVEREGQEQDQMGT